MQAGTIEVAPLAYMRGRTLNDAFIILDEAQNTTPEQMKMFLTRLGFGSKIVVTGDVTQVDLPGGTRSGLRVVRDILGDVDDVHFAHADQRRRRPAPAGRRHRRRLRALGRQRAASRRAPAGAGRRRARPADRAARGAEQRAHRDRQRVRGRRRRGRARRRLPATCSTRWRSTRSPSCRCCCVDVDDMAELHERWMGGEGPTDVLAFPMDELAAPTRPERPRTAGARRCSATSCSARRSPPAGARRRPLDGRRAAPADHARRPAPARLRPRASRTRSGRCSGCRHEAARRLALGTAASP